MLIQMSSFDVIDISRLKNHSASSRLGLARQSYLERRQHALQSEQLLANPNRVSVHGLLRAFGTLA